MRRWQTLRRGALGGLALMLASVSGCTGTPKDESVLPGVPSVVFVKRAFIRADGTHEVASGMGQVMDYDRYVPSERAGVYVLTPPSPNGTLRNLTADFKGVDVNGLDLSFDGKKVVFSMRTADDDRFHLYVANVDGSGKVKQLTFHDADDVQPAFLARGRIVFVTNQPFTESGTRADEYNHGRGVTQLATISEAAGDADRRLCSQNLSHATGPFAMANGLVGYSRWEHLGPVNDLKLFSMRPDCMQMRALAGQHEKPFNSFVQVRETAPGEFLGIGTNRDGTIQAGALMQVTVPVTRAENADSVEFFDEQAAKFKNLTLRVPTDDSRPAMGVGRYRSPYKLADSNKVLVSWADGDVNDRNELAGTAPNFGLYLFDAKRDKRELLYDDPEMWDLYAIPVVARAEPAHLSSLGDGAYDLDTPATIGSIRIHDTSLDERVTGGQFDGEPLSSALKQAKRVRVIEGFSSEIGAVGQFGLTMHEGAAILGEPRVYSDGSWRAEIPPYMPVHLQPIDEFDLAIRNEMLWIQGMPGESRICGGCHESRKGVTQSTGTIADGKAANLLKPVAERVELPWFGARTGSNVQDIFDARCVSCHSGGESDPFAGQTYTVHVTVERGPMTGEMLTYQVPYLDLSSRAINAFYENEAVTYPASYVSLLFPSAMMGEIRVDGAPVEWVIPGNARASRLIAKINVNSMVFDDETNAWVESTDSWAFKGAPHPEDVGGSMTREERVTLIRSVDLGGQYYSRRNAEGTGGVSYEP